METDPFLFNRAPKPFASDFYDGEKHYTFWGKDCVKKVCEVMSGFKGIVYAHNGGKFDFHYLLNEVNPKQTKIMILNGRIASLRIGKLEFRDSLLILPVPLSAYDKIDIDISILEKEKREKHKDEILKYLHRDTESLFELVSEFIENYGLGLTIRGRAFNELKKRGLEPHKMRVALYKRRKEYYFGGRCECFGKGEILGNFSYIDINSAYPYAMLEEHSWGIRHDTSRQLPKKKLEQSFITLDCETFQGVFPLREKTTVHFPVGRFIFKVTGWELVLAMKFNLIKIHKIIEVIIPRETIDFSCFILDFYKMKQKADREGDKMKRLFAKIFMNSCYGGFALDPTKFKEHTLSELGKVPCGKDWNLCKDIHEADLSIWEKSKEGDESFNVLTSASITGFVRAMLLESFQKVKKVWYCDTDSLICEGVSKEIEFNNLLGGWKLEGKGKKLWLAGKKLYALHLDNGEYKTASKGGNLSPEEIKKVAKGEVVDYQHDAPNFSIKKPLNFIERKFKNTVKG